MVGFWSRGLRDEGVRRVRCLMFDIRIQNSGFKAHDSQLSTLDSCLSTLDNDSKKKSGIRES